VGAAGEERLREGDGLRIDLAGDELAVVRQHRGHHQGAEAGEHAHFENASSAGGCSGTFELLSSCL